MFCGSVLKNRYSRAFLSFKRRKKWQRENLQEKYELVMWSLEAIILHPCLLHMPELHHKYLLPSPHTEKCLSFSLKIFSFFPPNMANSTIIHRVCILCIFHSIFPTNLLIIIFFLRYIQKNLYKFGIHTTTIIAKFRYSVQ